MISIVHAFTSIIVFIRTTGTKTIIIGIIIIIIISVTMTVKVTSFHGNHALRAPRTQSSYVVRRDWAAMNVDSAASAVLPKLFIE